MGISGRGLPEEGSQVIIIRSFPATLIIDEERIPRPVEHHVACLEVTVEETLHILRRIIGIGRQILGKETEVCLELQLMEVELRRFQETVFEVVQVKQHAIHIKLRLRITVGEVESTGTTDLDVRQLTDGLAQQVLLLQRISATGLTATAHGIEQRYRTEVGLQVAQLVVTGCQHLRHGQLMDVDRLCPLPLLIEINQFLHIWGQS